MSKKSYIALIAISSLAFLLLGYWLGSQKVRPAISARFVDEVFHEAVETRHDGAIVQLLNDKNYKDAESVAQLRYYSRVLLLTEMNSSAVSNVISPEAGKTLTEAKERWGKHQYVMPDAEDNEKLLRLMR
jgi:hypothetical protein